MKTTKNRKKAAANRSAEALDDALLGLVFNPPKRDRDICGAKTKNYGGRPCQARALPKSGRCKLHGGLSTGPKTAEGKARQRAGLMAYLARRYGHKPADPEQEPKP